jgi:PTH1 family peptidyl-tRNA hydrolase
MDKFLIAGLGNIGSEYVDTRHNAGFMVLDALAITNAVSFEDKRYGSVANMSVKGRQLLLLKPSTFMNLSGMAVRYWMQKEKIPLENLLVIVDDFALPFGSLRLRGKGSDGGHNGLKNIAENLSTENYARLRFGTGHNFPRGGQVDFVLSNFNENDMKQMPELLSTSGDIIKNFCLSGLNNTMNQFNHK